MSSDDMDDEGQFSEDDYSGSDEEGSFDEDEEIGEADDTHHDTSEHARKRHKNENSKFALPTKEEQMHLRETENLMRTNLLKLQVDEMMIEIKEDVHGNKSSFIEWINNLRDAIPLFGDALSEAVTVDWLRRKGIKGISLDGAESANLSIRYHPPVSTTIVGSFLHKTSTKPFLCVDIAVIMSPLSFEAKDIINFSYFDKRKLYLGVLLQQLLTPVNGSRFGSNVHITCMKGDSRKPVILIKPNKKTPYLVRLHPTLPAEVDGFPLRLPQLRATKNNVRPTYWTQTLRENEKLRKDALANVSVKKGKTNKVSAEALAQSEAYSSSNLDVSTLPPTACYNMAILEDVAMPSVARAIEVAIAECPCIRDAILLMKVWLTQRGLRDGFDSMDGHEAALLFLYLYSTKKILKQMSPLLAFTAALKFIVETRFDTDVLSISSTRGDVAIGSAFIMLSPRPAAILVLRIGPQGFISSICENEEEEIDSGATIGSVDYNAFWRWSQSSVQQLQSLARHSLEILQQGGDTSEFSFNELFIRKANFFQECDLYFHFPVFDRATVLEAAYKGKVGAACGSLEHELAHSTDNVLCDLTPWQAASRQCHVSLLAALETRVDAIKILSAPVAAREDENGSFPQTSINKLAFLPVWSPTVAPTVARDKASCQCFVTIGIILNKERSHQRVIRGPSADDSAGCEKFRAFWGGKTQLRRFHDGTIVEACVWGSDAHQSANQVPRGEVITTEIAKYILSRHLPFFCKEGVRAVCNQLESFLPAAVDSESGLLITPNVSTMLTKPFFPAMGDATTYCRRAVEAVDALRAIVVSKVEGLPLPIEAFRAASPSLRYTAFFPSFSHPLVLSAGGEGKTVLKSHSGERISTVVLVLPVVLQMHRSGKWPAELDALRKVKTAMLIRLSESLKLQFQIRSIVNRDYLDVMYKGFVFRMRMFTDNEVSLLARPAGGIKIPPIPAPDTSSLAHIEVSADADSLVRELVIAPLHHSAIHATHTENLCLGDTIRLLYRWMAGHLFSGHFDFETIELIAASVFLEAKRHGEQPQSATAGFLRSLRRIAEYEWSDKPLIIDFSAGEDITAKDISYIRSTFGVNSTGISKQLPLHIVTSYDKLRGYAPGYGQSRPERVVLRMVVAAARVSADLLSLWMSRGFEPTEELVLDHVMASPQAVQSRLNVIIKFNRSVVCKTLATGSSDGQSKWLSAMYGPNAFHTTLFSNLSASELSGSSLSLRNCNTPNSIQAGIFARLNEKFGSYALFFWDEISGDRIGIVWKPTVFLPQKFSLLASRLRLPVSDASQQSTAVAVTVLNCVELIALIIAEFDGLVERVDYL